MPKNHPLRTAPLLAASALAFLVGCAGQGETKKQSAHGKTRTVRTTAYTCTEPGGPRNALGQRLSCGPVGSAAADWSRFPVGTKFKIVDTGKIYRIDDYGSALVGTDTIDLYKPSRGEMRSWGVRHVDIQILEWGSQDESLKILKPRSRAGYVRRMVASLETKPGRG
jgi:3D (Asp-Asp-Asp) domain-containing protein